MGSLLRPFRRLLSEDSNREIQAGLKPGFFAAVVRSQIVEGGAVRVWYASEGVLEPLFLQASCAENVAKSAISIPSSRTMSEFT